MTSPCNNHNLSIRERAIEMKKKKEKTEEELHSSCMSAINNNKSMIYEDNAERAHFPWYAQLPRLYLSNEIEEQRRIVSSLKR